MQGTATPQIIDNRNIVRQHLRTEAEAATAADRELAERLGLSRPHPMPASAAEAEAWVDARDANHAAREAEIRARYTMDAHQGAETGPEMIGPRS